jgi:hypothetical protein
MNRLEKCEYLKIKGYTYDGKTGKIFNPKGKELISTDQRGYKDLRVINKNVKFQLWGHHFAFYMTYGNVDFIMLDHINKDKSDNRISNLRSVTSSQNLHNKESIGCWFDSSRNKWATAISIDGVRKSLGRYKTKEEAIEVYMSHKIKLVPNKG